MKNISKYLLRPFVLLLGVTIASVFGSCKKYLDKSPLSDINPTQAFQNFRNFQGFIEEMYNCVPIMTGSTSHNNWNFGEDEYWEQDSRMFTNQLDLGNYFAWTGTVFGSYFRPGGNPSSTDRGQMGNLWGTAWYAIRKANIGIENLDKLQEATDEEKKLIEGQLYFFRGFFHFFLLEYWGGLPYIDKVLPTNETPRVPRLSYHETAEKVNDDLLKAEQLLPVDWDQTAAGAVTAGRNNFRPNKIMAMAFRGKNLLLAGSPLMKSVRDGVSPSSVSTSDYITDYCKQAADVFAETLKLIESTNRYQLASWDKYPTIFFTQGQNYAMPGERESIFIENPYALNNRYNFNQVNDYRPLSLINSGIKCYPTANYVDNYGMANGYPLPADITVADPESGYDPEYPWRNRDPRFYNDIIIDGDKLASNGSLFANNEFIQYASLYTGGFHKSGDVGSSGGKSFLSGYMLTKFCHRMSNEKEGTRNNTGMVLPILRLADIYLMYAEAVSEGYNSPTATASGYGKSAVDAINFIRDRWLNSPTPMSHVPAKFLVSQEAFRNEYRRERAVELAFEGHRFVDLRRWVLLTKPPYTLKRQVQFNRATPNAQIYASPRNARVANYREETLFERQFTDKHYWFPFQVKDVSLYAGFSQNPGW